VITESEDVARLRIEERIRESAARARYAEEPPAATGGPRHHAAGLLRRLADRLEPPPRRATLSFSGR